MMHALTNIQAKSVPWPVSLFIVRDGMAECGLTFFREIGRGPADCGGDVASLCVEYCKSRNHCHYQLLSSIITFQHKITCMRPDLYE